MEITLSVWERINIEKFYPIRASLVEATALKDLRKKVDFSQPEITALEMKTEGPMVKWNKDKEFDRAIEITELEANVLKNGLQRLDTSNAIETNVRFVELCEKVKVL